MITQIVQKTRQHWLHRNAPMQQPEPDLDDYPLVSSELLRFADTDQNGHISNSVFAVLCQNARMDLFNDPTRVEIPPGHLLPIVKLQIEFLAELHWPGTVEIGTRFNRVGRSSIGLDQVIFDPRRCVAKARSTVVLIEKDSRRPAPLPPDMIKQIRSLLTDESEAEQRKIGFAWFASVSRNGDK